MIMTMMVTMMVTMMPMMSEDERREIYCLQKNQKPIKIFFFMKRT